MFAVFNWGPVHTAGGFNEYVTTALNKWAKENRDPKIEEQTVKIATADDGVRMFLTVVIRYTMRPDPIPQISIKAEFPPLRCKQIVANPSQLTA